MSDHDIQDCQVIDYTNGRIRTADSRSGAESTVNQFSDQMDLEVCRPGEDPQAMLNGGVEPAGVEEPDVEVIDETTTGGTEEPSGVVPPSEESPGASPNTGVLPTSGRIADDPLDTLPGWMITEVSYSDRGDTTTTVNKRGCQVIANYLGLDYETTPEVAAHETDFEYATYKAVVRKPNGNTYTGYGSARADGDDQPESAGWKLDMMASTRAYKRAVKGATGGGIEAFAKEQAMKENDE
jgi:hypothetical protein